MRVVIPESRRSGRAAEVLVAVRGDDQAVGGVRTPGQRDEAHGARSFGRLPACARTPGRAARRCRDARRARRASTRSAPRRARSRRFPSRSSRRRGAAAGARRCPSRPTARAARLRPLRGRAPRSRPARGNRRSSSCSRRRVRQRMKAKQRTVGSFQVHARALPARGLYHGEEIVAALGRRLGVDHRAARLRAEIVAVEGVARLRRRGDIREEHAPLHLSQVLGASDDLLSRVAALVEAHAADQLEVGHLRHELVAGGGGDQRDAGADVQPAPPSGIGERKLAERPGRGGRGQGEQSPSVLQPHRRRRSDGERALGLRACSADEQQRLARILDGDPGAQDVLRDLLVHRAREIARQHHRETVFEAPQEKAGKHASLRRAVRSVGARLRDVAGELSLEEGFRILSAEAQHPEVVQSRREILRLTAALLRRALFRVLKRAHIAFIIRGVSRLKPLILAVAAAAIGFCGWLFWYALSPLDLAAPTVDFSIRQGSSLRSATRQLVEAGLPLSEWKFVLLARINGASGAVKAGSYQATEGVTPLLLVRKIVRGEYAQAEIVFPEGWTFRQMRELMGAHQDLRHDTAALEAAEIMEKLGEPGAFAEGMFFPDTYIFAKGSSDLAVLARARGAMRNRLAVAWSKRDPDLPVADEYEALILASIVEKETGRESDRA